MSGPADATPKRDSPDASPGSGGESRRAGGARAELPGWASELIVQYESGAASQFILSGNVNDRLVFAGARGDELGSLTEFVLRVLLPRFDVVLSYDVGNGLRVEKGGEAFNQWPTARAMASLPRDPRGAMELITHYLRYVTNLGRLSGAKRQQVGVFLRSASLIAPALRGGFNVDVAALAVHVRDWSSEPALSEHPIATFLVTENVSDLHPLIVNNPRACRIEVPLPGVGELERALRVLGPRFGKAASGVMENPARAAGSLAGATLHAVETMLRTSEHRGRAIGDEELSGLKRALVERDTNNLIEFIEPDRTLDDLHGQEKVKEWLRQDIALWRQNDLKAMPMGYLFCGPVGTGKTFLVECLAGSAGVPVVKLKNFRDRWVGSTEGNLETIFRLLHALGRCIVFIDEADQALGRRTAETSDSGVGGRVYSMMAEEMSDTRNRGKIVWALASSRPDLIEVDLKRPGRIDVKIPLFPTTTAEEGFRLVRALCRRRGLEIGEEALDGLRGDIPNLLTPGAAEALAVKVYRVSRTRGLGAVEALRECLSDYQHPVRPEVLAAQIRLAVDESSELEFIPEALRAR